jgi:D-alanine-D-alanine ligase-like ATP-grasp enzyme
MIREPKKGSLKSNIADGGSQFSIPVDEIPEKVRNMSNEIHEELKVHDTDIYSLDFAYCGDDKKWYLIEINSAPGIWFPDKDKHYQFQFFNDLADHFQFLVDTYK